MVNLGVVIVLVEKNNKYYHRKFSYCTFNNIYIALYTAAYINKIDKENLMSGCGKSN